MIHANILTMLHNAGIIPTLDTFHDTLSKTALSQGLPVTASLQENTLTLTVESAAVLTLPLLCHTDQLRTDQLQADQLQTDQLQADTDLAKLTAIDESLCKELNTLSAAYPQIKWLPVGRFTAQQLAEYMKSPYICAVCDLTFLDTPSAEWNARCRQLRAAALGYAFAHMGIHNEDAGRCLAAVNTLQAAFGFPTFDIGSSVMVTSAFEVTKSNPQSICGHIGIETASVARAINDLQSKGFRLKENTLQYQPDGRPQSVYLDMQVGGFLVHLVQKR